MDHDSFLFDTKSPQGISDTLGYYKSSVLSAMKNLVKDGARYDTSIFILTGPRGYDAETLFEPYGRTRDILSWFADIIYQGRVGLANKQATLGVPVDPVDQEFILQAENRFSEILNWCITNLDPRAVFESLSMIPNMSLSTLVSGNDWLNLFSALDAMYPTYIVSPETVLRTPCRFPSISRILASPISAQMRTNLLIATMSMGKDAFQEITSEPILEIANWFITAFSADVDPSIGKPYVLGKIDVSKMLCYVYRYLMSMGDVEATVARYNSSMGPNPPESLRQQVEMFKSSVYLNRDAYIKLAKQIIDNPDAFGSLRNDTFAFIATLRVPETNAAYPIHNLLVSKYLSTLVGANHTPILGVSGSVHFNSFEELVESAASTDEPIVVAALRLSATRYFDGILAENTTLFKPEEIKTIGNSFESLIFAVEGKLSDAEDAYEEAKKNYNRAIEVHGEASKETHVAYIDVETKREKAANIRRIQSTISAAFDRLNSFQFLSGYHFEF